MQDKSNRRKRSSDKNQIQLIHKNYSDMKKKHIGLMAPSGQLNHVIDCTLSIPTWNNIQHKKKLRSTLLAAFKKYQIISNSIDEKNNRWANH